MSRADEKVSLFDVLKQCKQEEQYKCHGKCKDGWASFCYYDSSKLNLENNKSLDSQKDKCYGYYDTSVCEPCRNIYQIENEEVDCKKFYDSINKKNEECKGSLKSTFRAGG